MTEFISDGRSEAVPEPRPEVASETTQTEGSENDRANLTADYDVGQPELGYEPTEEPDGVSEEADFPEPTGAEQEEAGPDTNILGLEPNSDLMICGGLGSFTGPDNEVLELNPATATRDEFEEFVAQIKDGRYLGGATTNEFGQIVSGVLVGERQDELPAQNEEMSPASPEHDSAPGAGASNEVNGQNVPGLPGTPATAGEQHGPPPILPVFGTTNGAAPDTDGESSS